MRKETFHLLPANRVLTAVTTQENASTIINALIQAGFEPGKAGAHHGEESERLLDLDGTHHGFLAQIVRKYQGLGGPESHLLAQARAALAHDRYTVSVLTDGSEAEREKAFTVMAPLTERTIFFCGNTTIMILKVGKNYGQEEAYETNL